MRLRGVRLTYAGILAVGILLTALGRGSLMAGQGDGDTAPLDDRQLVIKSVVADHETGTIAVQGLNLYLGVLPTVILADNPPLALRLLEAERERLLVELPAVLQPGSYRLYVSSGRAPWQNDQFDFTFGAVGPQGIQGPQGAQGVQGPQGETGPVGPAGTQGPTGPVGQTGPPGADGAKGERGDTGDTGDTGDKGDKGDKGDSLTFRWEGTTLSFQNPGGDWSAEVDLRGPRGPTGPAGAPSDGGGMSIEKLCEGQSFQYLAFLNNLALSMLPPVPTAWLAPQCAELCSADALLALVPENVFGMPNIDKIALAYSSDLPLLKAKCQTNPQFAACGGLENFNDYFGVGKDQVLALLDGKATGLRLGMIQSALPLACELLLAPGSRDPNAEHDAWVTVGAIAEIGTALVAYHKDTGHFPETTDLLLPGYLPRLPADGWNNRLYTFTMPYDRIWIVSYGSDGKAGPSPPDPWRPGFGHTSDIVFELSPLGKLEWLQFSGRALQDLRLKQQVTMRIMAGLARALAEYIHAIPLEQREQLGYPDTLQELAPYLPATGENFFVDGWGRNIDYYHSGGWGYTMYSYGSDGSWGPAPPNVWYYGSEPTADIVREYFYERGENWVQAPIPP